MCEYEIDTGSDDNLMPTKLFKLLFQNTTKVDLNKCIYKK